METNVAWHSKCNVYANVARRSATGSTPLVSCKLQQAAALFPCPLPLPSAHLSLLSPFPSPACPAFDAPNPLRVCHSFSRLCSGRGRRECGVLAPYSADVAVQLLIDSLIAGNSGQSKVLLPVRTHAFPIGACACPKKYATNCCKQLERNVLDVQLPCRQLILGLNKPSQEIQKNR